MAGYKTLTTKGRIQQSPPLRIQQRQDTNHLLQRRGYNTEAGYKKQDTRGDTTQLQEEIMQCTLTLQTILHLQQERIQNTYNKIERGYITQLASTIPESGPFVTKIPNKYL